MILSHWLQFLITNQRQLLGIAVHHMTHGTLNNFTPLLATNHHFLPPLLTLKVNTPGKGRLREFSLVSMEIAWLTEGLRPGISANIVPHYPYPGDVHIHNNLCLK